MIRNPGKKTQERRKDERRLRNEGAPERRAGDRRALDLGPPERRRLAERREAESGPPPGWKDRRRAAERRIPEVCEAAFAEWARLRAVHASLANGDSEPAAEERLIAAD